MTGVSGSDDGVVGAVLRLADLAGKIEQVDSSATRRIGELARDWAAARDQLDDLCGVAGALAGRADEIDEHVAEIGGLLARMAGQISDLTAPADEADGGRGLPGEPGAAVVEARR